MMRGIRFLVIGGICMMLSMNAQAQFGDRLGKAIKKTAEDAAVRKAEQKTDEAVSKTIDKATTPNANTKDKKEEPSNNNQSSNGDDDAPVAKGKDGKSGTPAKLESYTQYDFVPGDQILFFEDFSQDNVGDFPDKWTTNVSGEVRTINIAPGKWFHPTAPGGTTTYLNSLNLPENFILEFDYIFSSEKDINSDWDKTYQIAVYNDDKEFDEGLYPGAEGFRLGFNYKEWTANGYRSRENTYNNGKSVKNPVGDGVNHIIVWVQKRRLRVYHAGAKVLDLPTIIPDGTTFNRFCFQGWALQSMPFISNIKITTAAPDVRSKLLTEGKIISYGINFDSGKDVVKPESYGAAKAIADVLKENPEVHISIIGHTDSDGKADANLDLSKRRAAAVKAYLVKEFGIEASRMETDGKGQTEPLAPNNTVEGKAKNRRVEFVKIKK